MDNNTLQIALQLARMYGVAETLNTVEYMDSDSFVTMMLEWTDKFMESGEKDLVEYFNKLFQNL